MPKNNMRLVSLPSALGSSLGDLDPGDPIAERVLFDLGHRSALSAGPKSGGAPDRKAWLCMKRLPTKAALFLRAYQAFRSSCRSRGSGPVTGAAEALARSAAIY